MQLSKQFYSLLDSDLDTNNITIWFVNHLFTVKKVKQIERLKEPFNSSIFLCVYK